MYSAVERYEYGAIKMFFIIIIKVFTTGQCQHYVNEREIYMLPFMQHDALLHFYGAEER